ncbi:geranylgeranyl pyrophosphate synthetase [Penicillium verhagenii]|uniref:geranylgeranyl pyrophosphate synthetase n=1 Tax=Penicillium verhagenii TaxID=1562060 RepID=UPI002545808A|nr:geranylgeranyl pyrophosphate synthetase [Penicillium verhagenii]KAJ5939215.1 geranylgeranyl pyrophosphate synthetase [Penicillium verhagenii]
MNSTTRRHLEGLSRASKVEDLQGAWYGYQTSVQPTLKTKRLGWFIPRESTLEIKTRNREPTIKLAKAAPQLWVSQTPKLAHACHRRDGMFDSVQVKDVTGYVESWEQTNQEKIRKLVALIKHMIKGTKECGGRASVRCDTREGTISITKTERKNMLPEDLYSKWKECIPTIATQGILEQDPVVT